MGDVTVLRGRGSTAGTAGAAGAAARAHAGEPVTIATLIARAFGVLGEPTITVDGTTPGPRGIGRAPSQAYRPGDPGRPGRPRRHLHVVRDA